MSDLMRHRLHPEAAADVVIAVTNRREAEALLAQARRCRRLAQAITDARAISTLKQMAIEYEDQALALSFD